MRFVVVISFVALLACRSEPSVTGVPAEKPRTEASTDAKYDVVVLVDRAKLAAFGVSESDVLAAIASAGHRVVWSGKGDMNGADAFRIHVATKAPFEPETLVRAIVATRNGAPVRMSDLAIVESRGK